ncbi:MAG: hypothetical protein ABI565_14805 [Vicinamibacteria bacterium]
MARWRAVLGLLSGVMLLLSAFAHTLLGGAAMGEQMAKAQVRAFAARAWGPRRL